MKKSFLFFTSAGVLLALTWLLYFFLLHDPVWQWLVYAGWVILALGLVFIFLSVGVLRSKGKPEQGNDFTHTTILVDSGIYAIVRHPLYLGWSLMYVAVFLFSQHWLILVLGVLGSACKVLISKQEDQYLLEKFGDVYEMYSKTVPAMNVLSGIMRYWRIR